MNTWVDVETRDDIVDFVDYWAGRLSRARKWFCEQIGISENRLIQWRKRKGLKSIHNSVGRAGQFDLLEYERAAIILFYQEHEDDGYRRCTYMMIDHDIVYATESTVYRVLKASGMLRPRRGQPGSKGKGFEQPLEPHEQWHMDISYIKVRERFYFLMCILDGFSRYIVDWELCETMTEVDVGCLQQRAFERYPEEHPRYITDNGKQFTGKEFDAFIAANGLRHTTTSPCYPQSNGKLERFHRSLKEDYLNRKGLTDQEHARRHIKHYIDYYNDERLHSAIGYITPKDKLQPGRDVEIHKERQTKLKIARALRKLDKLAFQARNTDPPMPAQAGSRKLSYKCRQAEKTCDSKETRYADCSLEPAEHGINHKQIMTA